MYVRIPRIPNTRSVQHGTRFSIHPIQTDAQACIPEDALRSKLIYMWVASVRKRASSLSPLNFVHPSLPPTMH